MVLAMIAFAARGWFKGAVGQAMSVIGMVLGLWAAGWISQWVGQHWFGARPAVMFWALRYLVAALGGLAIASLFEFWGTSLRQAIATAGPAGSIDRLAGVGVGVVCGAALAALMLVVALWTTWPRELAPAAARTRAAAPLLRAALQVCDVGQQVLPGSGWLKQRILSAQQRAHRVSRPI
jgi:uncharacterized membrane protein required for colicin V production